MFRFLILGLLRNGAHLHGYALVKLYRERSGAEVSTGNFYRELQRLVLDGLIRSADNPPQADARRTPYEITAVGIDVFDEWFTARDAAGGASSEDDISARALFMADTDPPRAAAAPPVGDDVHRPPPPPHPLSGGPPPPRRPSPQCSSTWKRTCGSA